MMQNIRQTKSYQLCGKICCFAVFVLIFISMHASNRYSDTIACFITALVLMLITTFLTFNAFWENGYVYYFSTDRNTFIFKLIVKSYSINIRQR